MDSLTPETGTSQDDAGNESGAEVPNEASTTPESAPHSPGDDAGDGGVVDAAIIPEASASSEGAADACSPCNSTACESIIGGSAAYDTCEASVYTCTATYESECKHDVKGACQDTCTATEYTCQAACYTDAGGSLVGCINICATEATSCNGGC